VIVESLLRFLIGGIVVSIFAVIGDVFRPRTFSGLFGAAPTIALATLGIAYATKSTTTIAIEGRSMILGAVGMLTYALISRYLIGKYGLKALPAAGIAYFGWFAASLLLWFILLR
jgi:hypothetical protein